MPAKDYVRAAELAEKRFFENEDVSKTNKKYIREFLDCYDVSPARIKIFLNNITRLLIKIPNIRRALIDKKLVNKIFMEFRRSKGT